MHIERGKAAVSCEKVLKTEALAFADGF